jgi:hypothetical protein
MTLQAQVASLSKELRQLRRYLSKRESDVLNLTQELQDKDTLLDGLERTTKYVPSRAKRIPLA